MSDEMHVNTHTLLDEGAIVSVWDEIRAPGEADM